MVDEINKPKKKGIFTKIEMRDDALKTIKDASVAILVIAGTQAAIAFAGYYAARHIPASTIESGLNGVLGLTLLKYKARSAAVSLLILWGIAVLVSLANVSEGGTLNVLISFIFLWQR